MRALFYAAVISFAVSTVPSLGAELVMKVPTGEVVIELNDDAPKHKTRLTTLVDKKFYDGLKFHRVIPGFMAQTGDPLGNGTGGSSLPDLEAELDDTPFERGVVGMARAADLDSANSQFFIMTDSAPALNGQYTVVGRVTSGMEHIDALEHGTRENNGAVSKPDTIKQMRIR